MSKPTEQELEAALEMAALMRDKKIDPSFIAKSLLSHHYRIKHLEEVLRAADRYINQGMSEQEHSHLIRAIEKAKDADAFTASSERERFGLE